MSALRYNLVKRENPKDPSKPAKFYASPTTRGSVGIIEISNDVAGSSSLSRGDLYNAIISLIDQMPKYLLNGYSVQLGDLGTFRIVFSSEGVEHEEEFNVSKMRDVKIYFLPGPRFKQILREARFHRA